jgi:hypothetical protein
MLDRLERPRQRLGDEIEPSERPLFELLELLDLALSGRRHPNLPLT